MLSRAHSVGYTRIKAVSAYFSCLACMHADTILNTTRVFVLLVVQCNFYCHNLCNILGKVPGAMKQAVISESLDLCFGISSVQVCDCPDYFQTFHHTMLIGSIFFFLNLHNQIVSFSLHRASELPDTLIYTQGTTHNCWDHHHQTLNCLDASPGKKRINLKVERVHSMTLRHK